MKKLAEQLDALAEKDGNLLERARQIASLRAKAAVEIHGICAHFVAEVSEFTRKTELVLDPAVYDPAQFLEAGTNSVRIDARGRILQIEFEAPAELVSTEDFRVPYTLRGTVRCFNRDLLQQDVMDEQLLFYCLEKAKSAWRFFDTRTYRTGYFDEEYLISLLEKITA